MSATQYIEDLMKREGGYANKVLAEQMRHFQHALAQFEQLIAAGQTDALEQLITQASHARATWRLTPGAQ